MSNSQIADENERLELEYLRQKVPKLEKECKQGSNKNIPALKYHFNKCEPLIEVSLHIKNKRFIIYLCR
jgi:hypothetical protein